MDFDHENVRSAMNEDRLSSLPDELIHQILTCVDSKFAVQTCLLSSRWQLLWTSMPCLNFGSHHFVSLPKFSKFVTNFLSHRNRQTEVTSVKLSFHGAASQFFVRKIANYVFSHNVQELTVRIYPKMHHEFPACLFSSQSLKHFTLSSSFVFEPCVTPKTPWDFPSLTSLHINEVTLCDGNTYKSLDLFSKCVNLKNLTLQCFVVNNVEVFDIITPQLSNLTLIKGRNLQFINLVAPQLENLTVIGCSIENPIAPPGLSTFFYKGYPPQQFSKEGFHSLNKVTISLSYSSCMPSKEEDARKTINLLQEVHSARFLTLSVDIVQCLSSFPDLVSHHPSPFSNLICLNIDSSMRSDAYKVKMSTEARKFLLENSPNATFIMELPEPPPTKAMKQKEAREKKKAKVVTDIDSYMTELRASLKLRKMHIKTGKWIKIVCESLMAQLRVLLAKQKTIQIQPERRTPIKQVKESTESHNSEMQMQVDQIMVVERGEMQFEGQEADNGSKEAVMKTSIVALIGEMVTMIDQENENFDSFLSRKLKIRTLLDYLPKRQRAPIEACYLHLFEESKLEYVGLASGKVPLDTIKDDYDKFRSNNISICKELQEQCRHLFSDILPCSRTNDWIALYLYLTALKSSSRNKMDFDHENVRSAMNEDRLSSLPDELIHQILSCIDSKFAVQTCLLSSRWKLLWTTMPCLNFASHQFVSLPKFSKFVTNFLSHRNRQTEVTSVKLSFRGAASQFFVRKIANYVFSHNVQELTVRISPKMHHEFPTCLFSSQSLKHFTLSSRFVFEPCVTPKTPWDFPSLTSLHINEVTLCDDNTYKSLDLFSKCVNLKNLTLQCFVVNNVEVFDIITPQLSNLTLIKGRNLQVINLVAPQLENLTVIDCSIKNQIAPPGLSTLSYKGYPPPQFSKEGFHSLKKATISLYYSSKEDKARTTINLLQEVHSARFLSLNVDIVKCLSFYPELLRHHPSPFSDLICLNIDSSMTRDAYKIRMSTEARNFLLENSPNATFKMELLAPPPTKAMKQEEARAKKVGLVEEVDSHMTVLQALLKLGKKHIQTREGLKVDCEKLMAKLRVILAELKIETLLNGQEAHNESKLVHALLMKQIRDWLRGMVTLIEQENENFGSIVSKMFRIRSLLENLPKQRRAQIEACCLRLLEESKLEYVGLASWKASLDTINADYGKFLSNNISTYKELRAQLRHLFSDYLPYLKPRWFKREGSQLAAKSHVILMCNHIVPCRKKMDFDHENVRSAISEDRLSSLPDELIHKILSCIDSKFAVQTCLLSSRWKLLWTTMPCLNFDCCHFVSLLKFARFVNHVLSHRNHEIEVISAKLDFYGAASQFFVRKIVNYVFSHNVQELTVFPLCLFSSQSLKHFTLSSFLFAPCLTPRTPWDFPALTSLHLNEVTLCDYNTKSIDLFSKCVNLKSLILDRFVVNNLEVFDIITPQLSNLTLIKGRHLQVINLVAPQLENLTVIDCSIKNPMAPPGLSTLFYEGHSPPQLSKEGFHSLNKVTISLSYPSYMPSTEEDARKIINLLQEVHSARFLTLSVDIVQRLSSFSNLVSHHPSPFSDLICLSIDSSMRSDAYKVKMSTEARKFLLENSPNATFIMELPEPPPTKAMKQKEAREKKRAELLSEIDNYMTELQASLELAKLRNETRESVMEACESLMAQLRAFLAKQKTTQIQPERTPIKQVKESAESHISEMQMQVDQITVQTDGDSSRPQLEEMQMAVEQGEMDSNKTEMQLNRSKMVQAVLMKQIESCLDEMLDLMKPEISDFKSIFSKTLEISSLLENLPKRQRVQIEARCLRLLEDSKVEYIGLASGKVSLDTLNDDYEIFFSNNISTFRELKAQCRHPPPRIPTLYREPPR
ncbi:hypothetical protein OSB04_022403, partial [Centaurea solstitialis]